MFRQLPAGRATARISARLRVSVLSPWLLRALARGTFWPEDGVSGVARHFRGRLDPQHACDDVAAIRVRPDRSGGGERYARAVVAGDPAGLAAPAASCPDHAGVVGVSRVRHQQRREHRRLAQRISWLAFDFLFQPADGGLHLPGGRTVPPREESGTKPALRLLRSRDLLARHDRLANAA